MSPGQLTFAILFAIGFTIAIIFSYKSDKGVHLKQYKGSKWVLIGFIIFVVLLLIIKYFAKNMS